MLARTSPWILLCLALTACGGPGSNAASSVAGPPPTLPTDHQAKCSVTKSQARPLIVEWPSADRTALEAQMKGGLVAVRYEGCSMEVLSQCRVPGAYRYVATTPKKDRITMHDADELYANVPLGAAKLESTLQKSGELNVVMTIVGRYEADRAEVAKSALPAACAGATHVVSALTAGAFEFFAGSGAEVGAGAEVMGAGAGARSSSRKETLTQDGDAKTCEKAAGEDKTPPFGCGALLRLEVVPVVEGGAAPLASSAPPQPAPAAPSGDCPDGMARVEAGKLDLLGKPVEIAPFCIDKLEVTVKAYAECAKAGGCNGDTPKKCTASTLGGKAEDLPINCVTAPEAEAFCASRGKRLPTEAEWEWAARGATAAQAYPWGATPPSVQACWSGVTTRGAPCPVGSLPAGQTRSGVADLAGNVWEWTSSPFDPADPSKGQTIRGGGYADKSAVHLAVADRGWSPASRRWDFLGFRCVKP